MRTEVKINGSTVMLFKDSLTLNSRLSERVSTAQFDIVGEEYLEPPVLAIAPFPALGGLTRVYARDEVQINRGATPFWNCAISPTPALGGNSTYLDKFFGGYVAIVDKRLIGNQRIYFCQCHDYNSKLNTILVDKTYTSKTEAFIITNLFTTYWNEIDTTTYVDGTNTVASIVFPDIYLGEALDMLAKMYNKDFYIDYDKKLHYFIPTPGVAPFELSDEFDLVSTVLLPSQTTQWREDGARLINRVTVKGTGVEVTRQDNASFAKYGEWFDYVHIDNNINTVDWANLVGDAILAKSAFENIGGTLILWQEGLVIGQIVSITNKKWSIDGDYLIQILQLRMIAPLQEEVTITVGDYSRDLIGLLTAIDKLERRE